MADAQGHEQRTLLSSWLHELGHRGAAHTPLDRRIALFLGLGVLYMDMTRLALERKESADLLPAVTAD